MFAMAAHRLGYRVHVFTDKEDAPAAQLADFAVCADFEDDSAITAFARGVAVVTFEFENVPAQVAETAARWAPVRPAGQVLHTTQNRWREKSFLRGAGLPVTPFAAVQDANELTAALQQIGTPAVLKTSQWGYDGKGQMRIDAPPTDVSELWRRFGARPAILERWVDFERELSVIAVRGLDGSFATYGPIENVHRHHILDLSLAPAEIGAATARRALEITAQVVEALDVVGVLGVEMFETRGGEILVNELAPRPHNSGHLTLDAHMTDQFEQQVRAVCGLPLGSTAPRTPAAMANLLGDLWLDGEPDWQRVLALPDVKLHLYGKREPRPGRKMGHLTALGPSAAAARDRVLAARQALVTVPEPRAGAASS
jgi:5-(carboxyamino)imidazole ribonucleotide synthase